MTIPFALVRSWYYVDDPKQLALSLAGKSSTGHTNTDTSTGIYIDSFMSNSMYVLGYFGRSPADDGNDDDGDGSGGLARRRAVPSIGTEALESCNLPRALSLGALCSVGLLFILYYYYHYYSKCYTIAIYCRASETKIEYTRIMRF